MRIFLLFTIVVSSSLASGAPLRALLVCGGCCHDYAKQSVILRDGIQARANVQVDVVYNVSSGTKPEFPMYRNKDWAKGYDVIIHDECAADAKEGTYVQNIVDAHKNGLPGVNLHCAMHSYRTGTDIWFRYLGLQSSGHGWKKPIDIDFSASEHVITKGLGNWTTLNEELYNNVKVFDTAKPLALGSQTQKDGAKDTTVVAWTNDYHGTRVFNTTLGHENETVADPRYLDLLVRGLLWSCDKLNQDFLTKYEGPNGKFETLSENPAPAETPKPSPESLKKSGNVAPRIEKLDAAKEAEILNDVKVPQGFETTVFANSAAANYPVYVAAAPNGDLYVSSDGNGSLGRDSGRGRIVRLRDSDKDGRADEVKEFVKEIDSPRGLVWDHDRLFVVHPPDVSVFIDSNADGVADEKKTLITGIAFGFKDRSADHTTNGLSLGIDGWLYISGGDFGFKDAVGTDGKHLQHRAGGVIRFRPDGSNMEIFSTGTRNILGTPISPLLDIFARDNTNDGGGWDVRFHHFTGLEDHGYPRLFAKFPDEVVQPIADYGGGSGCGSVYISEPGFPADWNDAPFTCDWGTGATWRHSLKPKGATMEETAPPQPFIKMSRPTDADVDAMSHVYQASWKGASFSWEGPDVGYIVRVSPKGYQPEPLPDFEKATDRELIALLKSPSQVRTLEAQRALLRRPGNPAMLEGLLSLVKDSNIALPARVAALYAVTQRATRQESAAAIIKVVRPLAEDRTLQRFVLRALGDAAMDAKATQGATSLDGLFAAGLKSGDARTRLEAIVGATRQAMTKLGPQISTLLGDEDPVVAHTAFRGLAMLGAAAPCFAILDNPKASQALRTGALRVLMRIHEPEVVNGILARLQKTPPSEARWDLLSVLCRLHFKEADWNGESWGTRPDTRGPYYQPVKWSETEKIAAFLSRELEQAVGPAAPRLIRELQRNRIEANGALDRLMTLAKTNPSLLPDVVEQIAALETMPEGGLPFVLDAAKTSTSPQILALTIKALSKMDSPEACLAALAALDRLSGMEDARKLAGATRRDFFNSPKLENHHLLLEQIAAKMETPISVWAEACVLVLSARKQGSPESRELSKKAAEEGWSQPGRRLQMLQALRLSKVREFDERVLAAVNDPDSTVAKAAVAVVKELKLKPKAEDKSPLVASLKPEEVIAAVMKSEGDVGLGEQVFVRQSCTACHAASLQEAQKGPYLGNIAQTYSRGELAANIIDPGKSIAQGFATEIFTLKDGSSQMGFVTLESAEVVKIRTMASQEFVLKSADITQRQKLPNSLMPPGLVNSLTTFEFASLLDYLESLSAAK
jgi:putative membrane-bound dehydrogenase-like protein